MKELRFSLQCGASNRKALVSRRCSQCTADHIDTELTPIPINSSRRRSCSNRSSSITSLQPTKRRTTLEQTSDLDKFDTLLMLAAERSNHIDARRKQQQQRQRFSSAPQSRRTMPLLLIESQQSSNHVSNPRSSHSQFTGAGLSEFLPRARQKTIEFHLYFSSFLFLDSFLRHSPQVPLYEKDDDDDPSESDERTDWQSVKNPTLPFRISRL